MADTPREAYPSAPQPRLGLLTLEKGEFLVGDTADVVKASVTGLTAGSTVVIEPAVLTASTRTVYVTETLNGYVGSGKRWSFGVWARQPVVKPALASLANLSVPLALDASYLTLLLAMPDLVPGEKRLVVKSDGGRVQIAPNGRDIVRGPVHPGAQRTSSITVRQKRGVDVVDTELSLAIGSLSAAPAGFQFVTTNNGSELVTFNGEPVYVKAA